ncbi:MAG: TIGR02221 family CRISPR-associated protein, partial [Fusobacterium periodonticum]|nr:TIGR02221 family CRISPR-associated protein [Fusobacterium periodonticum]
MSRVLIAGIGGGKNKETGTYRVANYKIEDKVYEKRSFITSALEEHYEIDKTIFIGTTGSMWDNLYEYYCNRYDKEYDENYHLELMGVIDNATMDTDIYSLNIAKFNETFKNKILAIVTKYGMNELEIFENFNLIIQLQNELKDGDEVYLDITHSFRSNAFWMFLVMNYLTDVEDKKITVKAITYGMLEAQKEGVAPVVDLNAFYKILQWIKGANNFKNYGNSYLIEQNIENEKLSKKLRNFSDALNMNYIASLRQSINSLKKLEEDIKSLEGPAKLIIPKVIKDFMDRFATEEKDYLFQAELAKWHFEQKRYAMAYININESIIGFIMDALDLPLLTGDKKKDENKLAKDWLNMIISRHETNKIYPNFKVDKDNQELHEYIKIF